MTDSIIKYALHQLTDKPVFINDAANGLACNCKCEKCNERLEAIQGKVNEWHFRHHKDTNCFGGQETAIHKLAKQIIVDNLQILIPDEALAYSQARQEERFGSIIPDVTVFANEETVYFEIAVTNPVDTLKENFYTSGQHKSIEIDLTNIPHDTTPQELKEMVLQQVDNKRKIFWTVKQVQVFEEAKNNLIPHPVETYKVNNSNEGWWTQFNPIAVGLFIIGIFIFLYHLPKLLTNKNRRQHWVR